MQENKLLPCPFCGGSAQHECQDVNVYPKPCHYVICTSCGIQGISGSNDHQAGERWNIRADKTAESVGGGVSIDNMCRAYWSAPSMPKTGKAWDDLDDNFKNEMRRGMKDVLSIMQPKWTPIDENIGHLVVLVTRETTKYDRFTPTTAFKDATGVWRVFNSVGGMTRLPFDPTLYMDVIEPPKEQNKE